MSEFQWPDEAKAAADPWEIFVDVDGHNSIRARGTEDILAALLPFVQDAVDDTYSEGYSDGYRAGSYE